MGVVIHLRTQSPEPANVRQFIEQLDDVVIGLGAMANGIVAVKDNSALMVRCIATLQASLEAFEGLRDLVSASGDHEMDEYEKCLRETKVINSRWRSELTKLASLLCATRAAAERARRFDGSVR